MEERSEEDEDVEELMTLEVFVLLKKRKGGSVDYTTNRVCDSAEKKESEAVGS